MQDELVYAESTEKNTSETKGKFTSGLTSYSYG